MHLRTRIMIWLNGLLLVTVVAVSGLTLFTTVQSLRERARQDALGFSKLFTISENVEEAIQDVSENT